MPVSVAAISVQVAVSGPTIKVRDDPNSAYPSMPAMAAHSPATGGTPIIAAYASPTGSATAATLRPAAISRPADSRVMPRKLFRPGRKRRFMVLRGRRNVDGYRGARASAKPTPVRIPQTGGESSADQP